VSWPFPCRNAVDFLDAKSHGASGRTRNGLAEPTVKSSGFRSFDQSAEDTEHERPTRTRSLAEDGKSAGRPTLLRPRLKAKLVRAPSYGNAAQDKRDPLSAGRHPQLPLLQLTAGLPKDSAKRKRSYPMPRKNRPGADLPRLRPGLTGSTGALARSLSGSPSRSRSKDLGSQIGSVVSNEVTFRRKSSEGN